MAGLVRRGESGFGSGLLGLRHEIDRLFDDFFKPAMPSSLMQTDFVPRIEVSDDDKAYHVCVELPGLKPEEVSIEVDGNVLTVRGERKRENTEKRGEYDYSESMYGTFVRSVQLPPGAALDKVDASMHEGILEVKVPKGETQRARKIPVRTEGAQTAGTTPPRVESNTTSGRQTTQQQTQHGGAAKA